MLRTGHGRPGQDGAGKMVTTVMQPYPDPSSIGEFISSLVVLSLRPL
jgi:hypothetical protein